LDPELQCPEALKYPVVLPRISLTAFPREQHVDVLNAV